MAEKGGMSFTRIARGVFMIDTAPDVLPRVIASYLIRGEKGAALIDVGYRSTYRQLLRALDAIGVRAEELMWVVLTHVHLDHCGAVAEVLERYPKAKVLVHRRGQRHLISPEKLLDSARSIFGDEVLRRMGGMGAVPEERVMAAEEEGEVVLSDITLRVFETPGHAPHHISVLIEPYRYVVVGDALASRGPRFPEPIPDTAPPQFSYEEAVKSVRRIFEHRPRLLLLSHYGPLVSPDDGGEEEVRLLEAWIEKIRTLKSEGLDPFSITRRIIDEMEARIRTKLDPVARNAVLMAVLGAYLSLP
ncbi:MAG: MBL fold metallo-hydrolase [Candidatus Caldarchaeales archaeon]|jgi:glyoxylase-like metal-dependent hydrolase (beta-lactamase superfamily II)